MRLKKFNVYAGYHEIHITDRILRRPYVFQKTFRNINRAARWIDKNFPGDTVVIDENLADYAPDPCWLSTNFEEDDIKCGLTELTLDNLNMLDDTPINTPDAIDIANWLHTVKPRLSVKFFLQRYQNLTYAQARFILLPYVKELKSQNLQNSNRQ